MPQMKLKISEGRFTFTNLLKANYGREVSLHLKSDLGITGKIVKVFNDDNDLDLDPKFLELHGDISIFYICIEDISAVAVEVGE